MLKVSYDVYDFERLRKKKDKIAFVYVVLLSFLSLSV